LGDSVTRMAFISDVHSNMEALEAVLDEIGDLKVYCLGDIVGYGASPNEVVRTLQEIGATCVIGNHDHASIHGDISEFTSSAAIAATWTSRQLSQDSLEFLGSLPREIHTTLGGKRLYMAHGSPDDTMWEYVTPFSHSELFDYYLERAKADVIALGHTHVPFLWRSSESDGIVFNPGSVGQPRDGDNRASYAIMAVEGDNVEVEHRRVKYDIERAAKKIIESGLPPTLASRLLSGD
jgi:putative phosphoesterase